MSRIRLTAEYTGGLLVGLGSGLMLAARAREMLSTPEFLGICAASVIVGCFLAIYAQWKAEGNDEEPEYF